MVRGIVAAVLLAVSWRATWPATAVSAAPSALTSITVTYDGGIHAAFVLDTATDRGPPATYNHVYAYDVDDHWSHGASSHFEGVRSGSTTPHPASAVPAPIDNVTTMTGGHGVVADGAFSTRQQLPVAPNPGPKTPFGPGSEKAWSVLNRVDAKGAPLPGYKGGSGFNNAQGKLPETPGVTYRESDVNPNVKRVERGPEWIVSGSDGSANWIGDHYDTFLMFRGPTP